MLAVESIVVVAEGTDDRRASKGSAELLEQVQRCLARWVELVERADRRTDPVMAAARAELAGFEPRTRELGLDGLTQQLKHLILLFDSGASPAALRSWIKAVEVTIAQQQLPSASTMHPGQSIAPPAARPGPAPLPVETPDPSSLAASFIRAQLAAAARPAFRAPDPALDATQPALDARAHAVPPPTQSLAPQVVPAPALPLAAKPTPLDPRLAMAPAQADPETWAVSAEVLAAALRAAATPDEGRQRAQNAAAQAGETIAGVGPANRERAQVATSAIQTSTEVSPFVPPQAGNAPGTAVRAPPQAVLGPLPPLPAAPRAEPANALERTRRWGADDFALDERRDPRVGPVPQAPQAPQAVRGRVSGGAPRRPSRAEDRTFGFRVSRKTWWALLALFGLLALLCAVLFVGLLLGD